MIHAPAFWFNTALDPTLEREANDACRFWYTKSRNAEKNLPQSVRVRGRPWNFVKQTTKHNIETCAGT